MTRLFFDDKFVKTLKAQPGQKGSIDYSDTHTVGLLLRLSPKNSKTWEVRYRRPGETNPTRLAIGHYDETAADHLTLKAARAKAIILQSELLQGQAITTPKKAAAQLAIEQAKGITVEAALKAFLAHKLPTLKNDNARYQYQYGFDEVVKALGPTRPLVSITRAEIASILKKKAATAPVGANRLRNKVQGLFKWAADEDGVQVSPDGPVVVLLPTDPTASIKKPHKEKKRRVEENRSLNNDELRVLLRAIQRTNAMSPEIKNILTLIALTSRRPNEMCCIEIEHMADWDDPESAYLDLPGSVMKAGLPYLMPVNPLAREVIQRALHEWRRNAQMTGRKSKYLFPTVFRNERGERPISANSVAQAMARLIDNLVAETPEDQWIVDRIKADRPTPYAFRRAVATGMAPKRMGIAREDRKAVMAHAEDDVLADNYDKYERLDEKREALLKWEMHVSNAMNAQRSSLGELLAA